MLWHSDASAGARARLRAMLVAAGLPADFVTRHQVCFERGLTRAGATVTLELQLFARHPEGLGADLAGPATRDLRRGLETLALAALSESGVPGQARLAAEPDRLVLRRENGWTPELPLRMEVWTDTPESAGLSRDVAEELRQSGRHLAESLRRWGLYEGAWGAAGDMARFSPR